MLSCLSLLSPYSFFWAYCPYMYSVPILLVELTVGYSYFVATLLVGLIVPIASLFFWLRLSSPLGPYSSAWVYCPYSVPILLTVLVIPALCPYWSGRAYCPYPVPTLLVEFIVPNQSLFFWLSLTSLLCPYSSGWVTLSQLFCLSLMSLFYP